MKKKILYVSSSRSDFGIILNLLDKIEKSKKLELFIIVTGSHIIKDFGNTFNEIKSMNFKNIKILKIDNNLINSPSNYIEKLHSRFTNSVRDIDPDVLLLLGDRYEIALIALITHVIGLPIIHIHGGEKTSGSKDDNYRHVISKLSQIHLVAHKQFKKRLIQLGENHKNIHIIGSLALSNFNLNKNYDLKKYQFLESKKKYFVITLHPSSSEYITKLEILCITDIVLKFPNINFVFTSPNQDRGYNLINKTIEKLLKNNDNIFYIKSFGHYDYSLILKNSLGIIGNSSSGIIEAPFIQIPTINIGERQNGRPMSSTIYNAQLSSKKIIKFIKLISSKKFKLNKEKIFYKIKYNAINKILEIIEKTSFSNIPLEKNFKDLK